MRWMCGEYFMVKVLKCWFTPPPLSGFISHCYFQQLVLEIFSLERKVLQLSRKDLEDGSLQVGKDYWELEDLSTTCPTPTQWRKRWTATFIEEKKGTRYWEKWHSLPRGTNYWIVWEWKFKWVWCNCCRSDGKKKS